MTIDVDGIAKAFFRAWRKKWTGRRLLDPRFDQTALEALGADYHVKVERERPPELAHRYCYSAIYANDAVEEACLTLLQLGARAQLYLTVDPKRQASFAIATDRPLGHVLRQYFPGLVTVKRRHVERVARGGQFRPRRLIKFSLPSLLGIDASGGTSLPIPNLDPAPEPAVELGAILSPLTGAPIGKATIALDRLMRGTLVAGTTGSGKTNTVLHLIRLLADRAWVLAFDVKREYRCLHATLGATVLGFTGDNLFTHNLLKAAGPPSQWAKQFAAILSEVIHRHSPAVGSKDVVTEELDRLYRQRDIYHGSGDWPHLGDLLAALERRQQESGQRESGWISSALRVLRSLMVGSTRQAFCVRQGLALERLMNGVTVIEFDGIGDPAASSLLASVLLQKIRNAQSATHDALQGVVVVEEAQHLLAQGSEATSVLAATCREIRSTGIGLVYVTQMPSEFSKHALANVNTLLVHRLIHPPDRSLVARMMDLGQEHRPLLGRLEPGYGVLHQGQPMLARVPQVNRPLVHDSDLPAVRVEREEIATQFARRTDVENRVVDLAQDQWAVLEAIARGVAIYPTGLREELGLSARGVDGALGMLIRKGLVRYCRAKKQGPGRPRLIHFVTPAGEEAYRGRHGRYPDVVTQRVANHAQLVTAVCHQLGIERLPHPRFDILYEMEGRQVAIEVETGSNNNRQILENIVKSVDLQGEGRFVCADDVTVNRVLQQAAKQAYGRGGRINLSIAGSTTLRWSSYSLGDK